LSLLYKFARLPDLYIWGYVATVLFIFEYYEALVYNYWGRLDFGLWALTTSALHWYHIVLWYVFMPLILGVPIFFYFLGTRKIEKFLDWLYLALYINGVYMIITPFSDKMWYYWTEVSYDAFEIFKPIIYDFAWWCWVSWVIGIVFVIIFGYLKNKALFD